MTGALQVAPQAGPFVPEDLAALREAVRLLEQNHLVARIAATAGVAVERLTRMLPAGAHATIQDVAERALRVALEGAALGVVVKLDGPGPRAWLSRRLSSRWFDRAAVTISGITGGAGGLAGTVVELPVTTAMMLRSIAQIATGEGEDVASEAGKLECLTVFAFGSPTSEDAPESGYYAVRMALAEALGRTAGRGVNTLLPAFLRQIATRFGVPATWKFAGQAVPLAGAAAGALINLAFIDHFQDKARGHFTVRRLERRYGAEAVRAAYDRLLAEGAADRSDHAEGAADHGDHAEGSRYDGTHAAGAADHDSHAA
jgi:hypothetical protein